MGGAADRAGQGACAGERQKPRSESSERPHQGFSRDLFRLFPPENAVSSGNAGREDDNTPRLEAEGAEESLQQTRLYECDGGVRVVDNRP